MGGWSQLRTQKGRDKVISLLTESYLSLLEPTHSQVVCNLRGFPKPKQRVFGESEPDSSGTLSVHTVALWSPHSPVAF